MNLSNYFVIVPFKDVPTLTVFRYQGKYVFKNIYGVVIQHGRSKPFEIELDKMVGLEYNKYKEIVLTSLHEKKN